MNSKRYDMNKTEVDSLQSPVPEQQLWLSELRV